MDGYGALSRSSKFIQTYHNMNTIFQTTGGEKPSLNGNIEIPNKTLANIKIELLMKSIQKNTFGK